MAGRKKRRRGCSSQRNRVYPFEGYLAVREKEGEREWLIKWEDFPVPDCTWEPEKKLPLSLLEYPVENADTRREAIDRFCLVEDPASGDSILFMLNILYIVSKRIIMYSNG
jgi:hypothetical protein